MKYLPVALSLFSMGSAILLFSCDEASAEGTAASEEARMTEYSEDLSVVMSQNGRRSYHFETPLLEGYSQAREPYREFRRGVTITTYKDDSLSTVDAVLTSNYAIYYTDRELWEARGDVVVEKSDGKTLYTQQLFWNARTKKIYSNVDSKIVQSGGRDVFIGEGFESDEEFKDWRFRRMKGRMEVDVAPGEGAGEGADERAGEETDERADERADEGAVSTGGAPVSAAHSDAASRAAEPAGRPARPEPTVKPKPEAPSKSARSSAPAAAKRKTVEIEPAGTLGEPQRGSLRRTRSDAEPQDASRNPLLLENRK